jgi:hypothetical protein
MKRNIILLIALTMLFLLALLTTKFQIKKWQQGEVSDTGDGELKSSIEDTLDIQPISLDKDSTDYLIKTFSKILFVPENKVRYEVDHHSENLDNNYHGNFWSSDDLNRKIEFFSQSGMLLSFPNGEYYCDDVQQFPKTLTSRCLPGTKEFNFGADGSPLKAASGWKLVSGDPTQDCGSPTYIGSVQVRGRLVWDYFYVEREWMFEVVPEDRPKIFKSGYRGKFQLLNAPTDLQKQLASATLDKPVKITLRGLAHYCEGAPGVSVTPPTKERGIYPLNQ